MTQRHTSACTRTKFSKEQLNVLKSSFQENPYPGVGACWELAKELRLEKETVKRWFQRRRCKQTRLVKQAGPSARTSVRDNSLTEQILPRQYYQRNLYTGCSPHSTHSQSPETWSIPFELNTFSKSLPTVVNYPQTVQPSLYSTAYLPASLAPPLTFISTPQPPITVSLYPTYPHPSSRTQSSSGVTVDPTNRRKPFEIFRPYLD